jgi:hypothetical protein
VSDSTSAWAGQRWKLRLAAAAIFVGAAGAAAGLWGIVNDGSSLSTAAYLIGLIISLGGGAFAAAGVRCPVCRNAVLWKAVREKPFPASLLWFLMLTNCPSCGASKQM